VGAIHSVLGQANALTPDAALVASNCQRLPGVSFHALDGGGLLFCTASQRLVGLDAVAGLCWLALEDADPQETAVAAMREGWGIAPEVGAEWFVQSLELFRHSGLLAGGPPNVRSYSARPVQMPIPAPEPNAVEVSLQLLDQNFILRLPPELLQHLEVLLRPLWQEPVASCSGHGAVPVHILRAGERWAVHGRMMQPEPAALDELASALECVLVSEAVNGTAHLVALHAAMLGRDGRAVLLSGASGAGKTTLACALLHAGWSYGSDELVLLQRGSAALQPLNIPPCVKQEAVEVVARWFPALGHSPLHLRYAQRVRFLPLAGLEMEEGVVQTVLLPHWRAGATLRIEPVSPAAGLARLLQECVHASDTFVQEDVTDLVRWHEGLRYYALEYGTAAEAVKAVSMLA
jgi:hypothetical protein